VWAPPFDESSGGIKCLHRLAVELQKRRELVFLSTETQNPKWPRVGTIVNIGNDLENEISVLPEIISGNPFKSKTVVRYLLNTPGSCSPDYSSTWGKDDLFYTYSRLFNTKIGLPDDRVLLCPHIDLDVFYDQHLPRSGRAVYRGKGPDHELLRKYPLLGGKESFRGDYGQKRLCDALNRITMLYVLDNATAMTEIARLCGCAVCLIPDGSYTKEQYQQYEFYGAGGFGWGIEESAIARATIDSEKMRSAYMETERKFQLDLTRFIEVTQNG
jgi:hypothetical protein